jgi:autotransporter-associated beta strand protein
MTLRSFAALAALLALGSPALAQNNPYTWNAATGNWDLAANWLNGLSAAEVPPSGSATALVFNASGSTNYTATNNIGAGTFNLNSLTINNTGTGVIRLAGATTANTLTFAGIDPTINVTGTVLFTGLMAGSATITMNGTGTFIHDSNNAGFTGSLVINGGTFINDATVNATTNFNPVSIVVNNTGTYRFGVGLAGNPNLPNSTYVTANAGGTIIWDEGEDFGGINLNGGTLNLLGSGYNAQGSTAQAWTSGTVTGSFAAAGSGAASTINKTTSGVVTITGAASLGGSNAVNIIDGTITHVNAANLGTKNVTLGGATAGSTVGVFEYQGASASRAGTFAVNAGGGVIRVTNAAANLTLSGAFSGAGPLAKEGPGTLVLGGALAHTGLTTVAGGTLVVTPVAASGAFDFAAGTTLAVNSGAGAATFTAPALNLAAGGTTIGFLLNTAAPTVPLLSVTGADAFNPNGGAHVIRLANQQAFTVGTYPLIDYAGAPITSGFSVQAGRAAANLVYDTANTRIDVNITGTDSIRWTGAINGTWDKGTAADVGGTNNWVLATGGTATNFIDTDIIRFDDTSTVRNVSLSGSLLPAAITVSTANTYRFQGTGSVAGSATLLKQGAGLLIVSTDNTNAGATTVEAGAIQVGEGGATGSLGTGGVTLAAGTTLTFNRTGTLTVPGSITGTGEIIKNGSGTVTLLGANTITGTTTINAGRLELNDLGGGGDLNSGLIVVNNGGTFAFGGAGNPDLPAGTVVQVNTGGTVEFVTGEDYGAIELRGGAYNSRVNNNLGGNSIFESGTLGQVGGVSGSLAGAGNITKTTPGTVTLTGMALNNTGTLLIEQGILSTDAALTGGPMTLGGLGTGTLQYRGATATNTRSTIALAEGGAVFDVTQATTVYTLSGVVSGGSGQGGLTKTGAGTLALTGLNDYSDPTTVLAGTLLVNGQTGTNSGTGTGTVTVAGGVFGGNGRAAGPVTVTTNGVITAGNATATKTLTLGNTLAITGGKYRVALFGTASEEASLIAATGTVTLSGGAGLELDLGAQTVDGLRATGAKTYSVVTAGAVSGTFTTNNFVALGFQSSEWAISYPGGNTVLLTFTPVPEPGVVLLVAAVGVGFVRRRAKA